MATAPASKRKSPWPKREAQDRELKYEAVLRTAVEFFNEKGFHATSLDDVADALNVTKPTIYHYFANKDEILFACVRRGIEGISDAAAAINQQGGTGLERLKAFMAGYVTVMTNDFGICVTRTADHDLSKESRARFRALKRETDVAIRAVVKAGMEDGSIAPGDPLLVTFALTGALNWIARWYDPKGALSPEQIAEGFVDTLVNGLAPRARPVAAKAAAARRTAAARR